MTEEKITEIFCLADNFVKYLENRGLKRSPVGRKSKLCMSEYITLLQFKQHIGIKTNKHLYFLLKTFLQPMFSKAPSYQQFNAGINASLPFLLALTMLLINENKMKKAKFYVVDSLPLPICSNGHRYNVKIDNGTASSSKNLNGWYHGYKFHLIINNNMEIVGIKATSASAKDHSALEKGFINGIIGWLVGDKGYICKKKRDELYEKGIFLLTRSRANMKKNPATAFQNYLLSKRQIVESVFSKLKYRFNIVCPCARSLCGYFVNMLSAVIAYSLDKKKNLKLYLENKAFYEIGIS